MSKDYITITGDTALPKDQMTEEMMELRKKTNEMWQKSEPISEEWRHFYRKAMDYLYDNQLHDQYRGKGFQRIQLNKLYPAYAQEIAVQLNRKTTLLAEPVEENDAEFADIMGSYLQWLYDSHLKFDEKIRPAATLDGKATGIYIARPRWCEKHHWDEEQNKWIGEIVVDMVNPLYFGVDPEGEDYINYSDCEYTIVQYRMALEKAIDKWPEYKEELTNEAGQWPTHGPNAKEVGLYSDWYQMKMGWDASAKDPYAQYQQQWRDGNYAKLVQNHHMQDSATATESPRYVTVTEYLFRDRTEKDDPNAPELELEEYGDAIEKGPLGGMVVKDESFFKKNGVKNAKKGDLLTQNLRVRKKVDKIPAFPFGRKVIRVGNLIVNKDREEQRYPYKKWDLILGVNLPLPHNIRGQNAVELARGLQDWLNVGASSLASYLLLCGSPITLVEEDAIAQDKKTKKAHKLRRAAGAIWKLCRGGIQKVKTMDPPNLSQGALQVMDMISSQLQDLTGGENISLGKTSSGEQTGTEVAILAENAAQRQSLSSKLMDAWTIRVFEHIAELVKRHKQPGEIVRVVGEQHANKVAQLTPEVLDVRFDLKLHVEDAMPFSKMARKQEAKEVFDALAATVGVSTVALNNLLDAYDAPNKEEIIEEVMGIQQAQAEAAQAQAQAEQQMAAAELQIKADSNEVKREGIDAQERENVREREYERARDKGRTYNRDKGGKSDSNKGK